MAAHYTEKRKVCNSRLPLSVIYRPEGFTQLGVVLTTKDLLGRLREKGVINADIARALKISPSRVTDLFDGTRALKLDEAVRLAEAFDLESPLTPQVPALPGPVSQLIVQHIARELGRPLEQDAPQLQELAEDLRAFSEYVTDPKRRESLGLAEEFFEVMRIRRPTPVEAS